MVDGPGSRCFPSDVFARAGTAGSAPPAALTGAGEAGTLVLDWNLEIIGADSCACRLLDREREAIVGRSCLELVTPPRRAREAFDALRAADHAAHTDCFDFVRLSGSALHAQVQMQLQSQAVAPSLRIVLTVRDAKPHEAPRAAPAAPAVEPRCAGLRS